MLNGIIYKTTQIEEFTTENIFVNHNPAYLTILDVTNYGYVHVDGQSFEEFDNIVKVVANHNQLNLKTMQTFKSLESLSLRNNELKSVEPISDLLIHLDVSNNFLKPEDLTILSKSKLQSLEVRSNRLCTIPENIKEDSSFLSLCQLDLSDNNIINSRSIYLLSTLHNLKQLLLSNNGIKLIPYIVTKDPQESFSDSSDNIKDFKDSKICREEDFYINNNQENLHDVIYYALHIPFVSLVNLDLSGNLINNSLSLLSLLCWPAIKKIELIANPVTSKKNVKFELLKDIFRSYNIDVD
ncbi:toll-like receptor 3 [Daktulosphaira vitifoliae]|uniref:toll-like receptor 3 n=1 Tax=Daktulosphaira vitifoliae TaxID=58002 RepID=UPI0021AB091B|nr:toll-like receptor 3 [Daktulosphaira vitifoliae]